MVDGDESVNEHHAKKARFKNTKGDKCHPEARRAGAPPSEPDGREGKETNDATEDLKEYVHGDAGKVLVGGLLDVCSARAKRGSCLCHNALYAIDRSRGQ